MRISILCSSLNHPVQPFLEKWAIQLRRNNNEVEIFSKSEQLKGGDFLFLVSCSEIVNEHIRRNFRFSLVLHASELPRGRGWSPSIWKILEGSNLLVVTLLEANEPVDTGDIWGEKRISLEGHELYDEINKKLFDAELLLMTEAVTKYNLIQPRKQLSEKPTYYEKRTPDHSRLDPHKSIAEQFNLLRVADPQRYPCFFEHRGQEYVIRIEKVAGENNNGAG